MKKTRWGILLLVLALAASLVLAGCLNPSSPPGSSNPGTSDSGTSNTGTSNTGTSNTGDNNTGGSNPYERYTRPNPPANVTATAVARGITIRWSAVSGATDYLVYRANNQSWIHLANTKSTSYTDTAVGSGKIYYYYVTSWNAQNEWGFNESSYSETVSAKAGS